MPKLKPRTNQATADDQPMPTIGFRIDAQTRAMLRAIAQHEERACERDAATTYQTGLPRAAG